MDAVRADVLLLPVGGTCAMTAAAASAGRIRPQRAIPVYWGGSAGGRAKVERFKQLCPVPGDIPELTK